MGYRYRRRRGNVSVGYKLVFYNGRGRPRGRGWYYHRKLRKYVKRKRY